MINIYRIIDSVETEIASVSDRNATFKEMLMSDNRVIVSIISDYFLDVKDGDYIYYNGLKYSQNRDVEYTKYSDVNYQFDFDFEHPSYKLLDKLLTYELTNSPVFTLTGKLVDFVDLIVWNMNYHTTNNPRGIDSGWTRGSVVDTDYFTLTFGSVSCRDAITQIATAFNAEFYFSGDGKTINFVDHIENETGLEFVQGEGGGLYSITQQNVDTRDTITRVYAVGGNKNVPNANADENGNLKLPEIYLQNTSEYSRIVEKRVVFEDVFPHFVGDVESVSGTDNIEIVCSDIDFDLNEIAVGSEARINFLTGSLMGISFQFQFDFATKKVTLIPQNDETALTNDDGTTPQVPQPLKKAVVGDKFNFTGVVMPVQYVNAAITKLREKATSWLDFYSRKRVKFILDVDYRWMRDKQELHAGDLITIKIPERNINKLIRVTEKNKNLFDGKISITVSNYLDENWEKKVDGAISSLQTTVSGGGVGAGVDILERYDARPSSDRNVMSSLRSEKNFLRKDMADTAAEHISFEKGLDALGFVQDKFAGAGAGIYEDEQGNSVIEVDKLSVRKEAWFNEIIINQIRFQGGIVVYSAANLEVLSVVDGGSYLQVSFDTKDGQIANQFAVDDQVRCQRFSGGSVIKYYMSRVTSVGTDYIRLSKSDIDGTLNVEVGDALVQFGNRTNTARQSLIEVNVLDGGKQTFYQGVNSYSLTNKNYLELGRMLVDGQWKNMIRSYGGAYIGNRDLSSFIQYNETTGKVEIKAKVEFESTQGDYKTVEQAIGDIEIGGVNTFSYRDRYANMYWWNGLTVDINNSECPYGFFAVGSQAGNGALRISNTITGNGLWTVSFEMRGSQNAAINVLVDICDLGATELVATIDNTWKKYEVTVNVTNWSDDTYHFVDFQNFYWAYFYVRNIKIEHGNKATAFSKHPADVAAEAADVAQTKADTAQANAIAAAYEYGNGANMLPFSDLQNGWAEFTVAGAAYDSYGVNMNADWSLNGNTNADNTEGLNTLFIRHLTTSEQVYTYAYTTAAYGGIIGGKKYIASIYAAAHRCKVELRLEFYDKNGNYISNLTGTTGQATNVDGGAQLSNYARLYVIGTAPSNAALFRFMLFKYGANTTDSYGFFCRPQLEEVDSRAIYAGAWKSYVSAAKLKQIQAQAQAAETVGNAIKNNLTTIDGGLILTTLIKMLNGVSESAGMAAKTMTNDIAFWGGGTLEEAIQRLTAFGVTHSGEAWFKGAIEALSGKIGLFEILAGNIIGRDTDGIEKIRMGIEDIPAVSNLSGQWVNIFNVPEYIRSGNISYHIADDNTGTSNFTVTRTYLFYIPYATTFKFYTQANTYFSLPEEPQLDYYVQFIHSTILKNPNGTVLDSNYLNGSNKTVYTAGWYTAEVTVGFADMDIDLIDILNYTDSYVDIPFDIRFDSGYCQMQETVQKTAIGKNGFYSYFSALEHIFFKAGVGFIGRGAFDLPAGLGGASVSSLGVLGSYWGKLTGGGTGTGQVEKSGSNYIIHHNMNDTTLTVVATPISTNVAYISSKTANAITITCSGGFDFVLIRTK